MKMRKELDGWKWEEKWMDENEKRNGWMKMRREMNGWKWEKKWMDENEKRDECMKMKREGGIGIYV
jgi:hypothetical protein